MIQSACCWLTMDIATKLNMGAYFTIQTQINIPIFVRAHSRRNMRVIKICVHPIAMDVLRSQFDGRNRLIRPPGTVTVSGSGICTVTSNGRLFGGAESKYVYDDGRNGLRVGSESLWPPPTFPSIKVTVTDKEMAKRILREMADSSKDLRFELKIDIVDSNRAVKVGYARLSVISSECLEFSGVDVVFD